MRTTFTYNKRLLRFADHLNQIKDHPQQGLFDIVNLVSLEDGVMIPNEMKYSSYLFEEALKVFPEINQEESLTHGMIDFFNLSLDEMGVFDLEGFHLVERFGGKPLTMDATPQDIAFNIIELVRRREGLL